MDLTASQQVKQLSKEDYLNLRKLSHIAKILANGAIYNVRKHPFYCLDMDIGTLVCGYNDKFQHRSNIGRANNQSFVNIPFGKLRKKLEYLCGLYGIVTERSRI